MAEFKLGRLKFVWKGVWAASTGYYKDDVVSAGGISYICIVAHTSAASFAADAANWQQMAGGTQFRGTWAASTNYIVGDLVGLGAIIYYCATAHTSSSDLNTDAANWLQYSQGLNWRNAWTPSTLYRINDLVKFGADVYIVTVRHTSSSTFDATKFNVFTLGLEFANSWNNTTTYAIGDIVTYGGYAYNAIATNVGQTPSTASGYWSLLTTGFSMSGTWNSGTAYKVGSVVTLGGWSYVAVADSTNQTPFIGTTGVNATYWNVVVKGFNHTGAYNNSTAYNPGDVVLVTSSTYVAIAAVTGIQPPNATYWQIIGQGGVGATLTQTGDLAYRFTDGSVIGLHMSSGTNAGGQVADGMVLKAYSQGGGVFLPRYGEFGYVPNVWYVAPSGTDAVGSGRTLDKPFATIKYACSQAGTGSIVRVLTGTYAEQLPIRVPAGVTLAGDDLRSVNVGPASGTSDDGITPNNRSRMFLMNNSTEVINMSLTGLTGQMTGSDYPSGSGVFRLTAGTWPSTTASGAYFAIDPTGSITTKSPYIQNCTCTGDHAVGAYINGTDTVSGFDSMLLNNFTCIIDGGMGTWIRNGAKAEIISSHTYYAYIGFCAETGGVIRGQNNSNNYGVYGAISTDLDPTDTGYTGAVANTSPLTGSTLIVSGLSQSPKAGNIVGIAGQSANFVVSSITSYAGGTATLVLTAPITIATTVSAVVTIYQKFSQIRLQGHDFVAIGTGNIAATAYPNVNPANYIPANQALSQNYGSTFYASTDQDGTFSVSNLLKVSQETGLVSITGGAYTGQSGATITQFSTDATLSANSDSIVPTQKAIRSYISGGTGVLSVSSLATTSLNTPTGSNSDLSIVADGTGVIQLNDIANYNFSYAQITAQAASVVANKDYVDQSTRSTLNGLFLDANGNLFWTNDVGTTAATIDGSLYTDFFIGNRASTVLINTSTGNLQVTY